MTKMFQTEIRQLLYNRIVPADFMAQCMIPLNLQHHYVTSVSEVKERNTSREREIFSMRHTIVTSII
jgi:hypothetical protein